MAKIQFETGQIVEFDGQPTQTDIDEVAKTFVKTPIKKSRLEKTSQIVPNLAFGVLKEAGSILAGASSVGERLLQAPLKTVGIKTFPQTGAEELGLQRKLEPVGTAQKIGAGITDIGSFFLPGGASTKLGKVAQLATKGRVLPKIAGLGTRALTEAGLVGGQTALQQGEVGKEARTGAIIGATIPVVGKALAGTTKLIGEGVTQLLGRTTGAGEFAIKEAINNPSVIKFAREAGAEGAEGLQKRAVEEAKNALDLIKQNRATTYKKQLEKIKLNKIQQDELVEGLRNNAKDLASPQKFDITLIAELEEFRKCSKKAGGGQVCKKYGQVSYFLLFVV